MSEQTHLSDVAFADLPIPEPILRGLHESGLTHCTPIQAKVLPLTLAGEDVTGQARTGSGKTACFVVSVLNHLLTRPPLPEHHPGQPRALILTPTRELAIQVHRDLEALGRHTELRFALAYGGTDYEKQRRRLQAGCDVLVATPGRLIDYYRQRVFSLKGVQAVVLDEADRMFDLGFIKDIRYLLRRLPEAERRLNLLFSATISLRVQELAYEHLNGPQLVQAEEAPVSVTHVRQSLYYPAKEDKPPLLVNLLKRLAPTRAIVFVNTKRGADFVERLLIANDIGAAQISGDVPQRKRQRIIFRFEKGEFPVLVATDVAARGLHIPEVSHVINYDLPQDPEDYVHRVGRTARAGSEGDAISFACEETVYSLPEIEAYIDMKIPVAPLEDALLAPVAPPRRREKGKRRGDRPAQARARREGTSPSPRKRRRRRRRGGAARGTETPAPQTD